MIAVAIDTFFFFSQIPFVFETIWTDIDFSQLSMVDFPTTSVFYRSAISCLYSQTLQSKNIQTFTQLDRRQVFIKTSQSSSLRVAPL